MRSKKSKVVYKRSPGTFSSIPHSVGTTPNYPKLSRDAKALLLDLTMQLKTHWNGTLVVTLKAQREQGWKSKSLLYRARDELVHYGYLSLTRQGGRNRASYYALTFFNIQAVGLDVPVTTEASDDYKFEVCLFEGIPRNRRAPKLNRCPGHKDNLVQLQGQSVSNKQQLVRLQGQFDYVSHVNCPSYKEPLIYHMPVFPSGPWYPPWRINA